MREPVGADRWAEAAAYESFMGRWGRAVADAFVGALAVPAGSRWLDLGCGTGALTSAIVARAAPSAVVAWDPSPSFVAYARERERDPRVRVEVGGAEDLTERAAGFDVIASSLVLNFLPDPVASVRAMSGAIVPGGRVAACVWDYADGMRFLRVFWDAARSLDPAAADLDEGVRFPICTPAALAGTFRAAGLAEVATSEVTVETRFAGFDDYWRPFLGGVGPAGTYVAARAGPARDALARAVEARLPREPGGVIALTARAWIVQGRRDKG